MEDGAALIRDLRDFIARGLRNAAYRRVATAQANLSDQLLIAGEYAQTREIVHSLLSAHMPRYPRAWAVTIGNGAAALVLLERYEEAFAECRSHCACCPTWRSCISSSTTWRLPP